MNTNITKNNFKRKKLILSSYDDIHNPFYGGGGAMAVHKIAKYLSDNNNVIVLSWNYNGKKKEIIDGVHYQRFGFPHINHKFGMLLYQILLPFFVIFKKYDIWFESFCPPFTTAMLPMYTNKPVVGIVHMLASEDMERKYKLPFRHIENLGLKHYKNIIVTSESLKQEIKRFAHKAKISVISNGIDRVYHSSVKSKKYILYLGRIEVNQKGLDLLIKSFKLFNEKQNQSYKLVIAGSGEKKELAHLKNLVLKAELTDFVTFTGKIHGDKKTSLIRHAACLVVPSRFETYSIVSLEALAHRIPLICFDINGLSWIPQNLALKIPPFDTNKLAKAMQKIVSNKDQNYATVENGCNYAKQFTWESVFKQYDSYINSLATV